ARAAERPRLPGVPRDRGRRMAAADERARGARARQHPRHSRRRLMRVVFAPDSFKGTITAADAAQVLADAWLDVDPTAEVVLRPMADGGEGTVAAFAAAVPGAVRMPVTVDGPAGTPVETSWLLLPASDDAPQGTAVIDLASTSGIELLDELRPWDADSSGFGQAIAAAMDHGVSRLVLGIGSSASTDGGIGMLRALGARF